jgi:predicted nuclease with TOPRIM domain
MWGVILGFIKNKVFTPAGGFLTFALILFLLIIVPNTGTILTKLGFETTTSLKAELVKTQEQLKRLHEINTQLNNDIVQLTEEYEEQKKAISEVKTESSMTDNTTENIAIVKKERDRLPTKTLKKKAKSTSTTIVLPKAEIDQLSANNIDAINQVYDELFT